jgi:hypothetical protein
MTTMLAAPPSASVLRCDIPAPVPEHSPVLAELMGGAIVLIVLAEAGGMLGWSESFHFELGVDILFILFGCALARRPRSRAAAPFLAGQLGPILIPYWIVLTLYWASNTHFLQLHYNAGNLVLHYLGAQACWGDASGLALNGQFCLVTALLAFVIFYRLGRTLLDSPERLLLAAAAIAAPVALAFFYAGQSSSFGYLAQPLPGFFLGLLLGRLLAAGRIELKVGATLALAAFILVYVPYTQGVLFNAPIAGLGLMGVYVFGWKRLAAPALEKWTARILKFVGIYWLEILLIHEPLIRDYNYYLHGRWFGIGHPSRPTLALGMAIGLALTLLLSVLLRRLVRKLTPAVSHAS